MMFEPYSVNTRVRGVNRLETYSNSRSSVLSNTTGVCLIQKTVWWRAGEMPKQCGLCLQVWAQTVGTHDRMIEDFESVPGGDHPQSDHRKKFCHVPSLLRDAQLFGNNVGCFPLNGQFEVALDSTLREGGCFLINLMGDG